MVVVGDPAADELPSGAPRTFAAEGAQVPQPVETVEFLKPGLGGAHRIPGRGRIPDGLPAKRQDALDDLAAAFRIAGPDVAADSRAGRARHPAGQEQAIEAAAK